MTAAADRKRRRRQKFATPGGFHDRLVSFLAKALPAGIGVVAAVMILSPLSPRGEVSFLLDRNKVAVTGNRVAVNDASYRGQDAKGRPFRVTAGDAVQVSAAVPVVSMRELVARMLLADGPAMLRAPEGEYNYRTERVTSDKPITFTAADGYRMVAQNVAIDLDTRRAVGSGGVSGAVPSGTFTAGSITADLEARTVTLDGRARMRMVPGKLRF